MRTLLGIGLGLVGVFAASLAVSYPATAAFKLTIADSAAAGTKVAVADRGSAANALAVARSIAFLGPSIPDWGSSPDLFGGTAGSTAFLTLRGSVSPTKSDSTNLIIALASAEAGSIVTPRPFNLDFSTSRMATGKSRTADLYVNDADADFSDATDQVGSLPAANASDHKYPRVEVASLADPFAMSMDMLVAYDAKGKPSSEATTRIAPIPGSLVLFGSALLGLVLTGRFSRRANATT